MKVSHLKFSNISFFTIQIIHIIDTYPLHYDYLSCENFIDLVDEVKIAQIGVVAPLGLMKSEAELLKAKL